MAMPGYWASVTAEICAQHEALQYGVNRRGERRSLRTEYGDESHDEPADRAGHQQPIR